MSDLLQRLIDRTRRPLSAVRPIFPSVYAPADQPEPDAGLPAQPYLAAEPSDAAAEPAENNAGLPAPPDVAAEPSGDSVQPLAERRVESEVRAAPQARAAERFERRTPPARPALVPRKTDAASRTPVSGAASGQPPPGQDSNSAPESHATGAVPTPTGNPSARPAQAAPPQTKTVSPLPPSFPAAPSPARFKPAGAESSMTGPQNQLSGQVEPATAKTVTTPSLGSKYPLTPGTNQAAAAATLRKFARLAGEPAWAPPPLGVQDIPARETQKRDSEMPVEGQALPARFSESDTKPNLRPADRSSPIEVRVSIGHIEVKSAQPTPAAPRRSPQRPRVSLEEFLKASNSGGSR